MISEKELNEFLKSGAKKYMSGLTIDCVIFGYHQHQLRVLLGHFKGLDGFALPGGYIRKTELLSVAAKRILKEGTGLDNLYLEQFYMFGDSSFRSEKIDIHPSIANTRLALRTFSIGARTSGHKLTLSSMNFDSCDTL